MVWYVDNMEKHKTDSFFAQVYDIVAQIPAGRVISYGQVASLLGNPRAARSVGWALSACPEDLPWQRVVMADGTITGGPWAELRRELLVKEGVAFLPDGRVDMKTCRWNLDSVEQSVGQHLGTHKKPRRG